MGLLWGVCNLTSNARDFYGFVLMILSWCSVEVPRYSFYVVKILGIEESLYFLKWIRYSLFLILYPTGISGELICVWHALPFLAKNDV